jgi:hypothetical protein
MTGEVRSWLGLACSGSGANDMRNQRRFVLWALGWAVSFVGASFLLEAGTMPGATAYLLAAVPAVAGLGTAWAYVRFLKETDELVRVIHLESLAAGFAAGVVSVMSFSLFERLGGPALEVDTLLMLMVFAYAGAQVYLTKRYA